MLVFRTERLWISASLVCAAAVCVVVAAPVLAGRGGQQQNNTPMSFNGEIADSACAAQHSHDDVMKKQGYKNAKECTLGCVQDGAKLVLYTPANNTVYQLDDQEKPAAYAGQKVTIVGTYDGQTKTIHIESIEAAP